MRGNGKLWIMVAGPYRSSARSDQERQANLDVLNRAAVSIFRKGHIPIVGVNLALPLIAVAGLDAYDEIMMPISLAAAERCDAVLRVGGRSSGADLEVELIRRNGGVAFADESAIPRFSHES